MVSHKCPYLPLPIPNPSGSEPFTSDSNPNPQSRTPGSRPQTSDPRPNPRPCAPDPLFQASGLSPPAPDPDSGPQAPHLKHQTPIQTLNPVPAPQVQVSGPSPQIPDPDPARSLDPRVHTQTWDPGPQPPALSGLPAQGRGPHYTEGLRSQGGG